MDQYLVYREGVNFDYAGYYDHSDALLFFYDFFSKGMRLPLDLFVVKFLAACHAIPCDLQLATIRVLIVFTVVSRMLGFETDLHVLCSFVFTLDHRTRRITARFNTFIFRLFSDFLGKRDGWKQRVFLMESRKGWSFRWTSLDEVRCLLSFKGNQLTRSARQLYDALRIVLGVSGADPRRVLGWEELATRSKHLRATSILRHPVPWVEPRIPLFKEVVQNFWGNCHNGCFLSQCLTCTPESRYHEEYDVDCKSSKTYTFTLFCLCNGFLLNCFC